MLEVCEEKTSRFGRLLCFACGEVREAGDKQFVERAAALGYAASEIFSALQF